MSEVEVGFVKAKFVAAILGACLSGCVRDLDYDGPICSAVPNGFFRQSFEKYSSDFRSFDLEKKFSIYLCAMHYHHPPTLGLADIIAEKGEKAVGFLKTKLSQTKDDAIVWYIVEVFEYMHFLHTYDVAGDRDLVGLIVHKKNKMKDSYAKKSVQRMLDEIQR